MNWFTSVCLSVFVCFLGIWVGVCSQSFQVRIIDDEEYEKHENFFIVLEEPRWLKRGISGTFTVFMISSAFLGLLEGFMLILTSSL